MTDRNAHRSATGVPRPRSHHPRVRVLQRMWSAMLLGLVCTSVVVAATAPAGATTQSGGATASDARTVAERATA